MSFELKNKRSYTAKHYNNGDGTFTMDAHVGHIHYFNKLGVGDSIDDFREIDETLSWNDKKKGWEFKYHSFNPFLPEYADGWVEFRDLFDGKDQTIRYKAVCSHIKGRLVNPEDINFKETQVNCVIYDDAFGVGFDYILYFTRSTLKKVVRVRDGFKGTSDLSFKFEVEFPNGKDIIRTKSKEKAGYILDVGKSKAFDTAKQTLVGKELSDGKEWFTYIKSFKVWDSKEIPPHQETIIVDYTVEQGKRYLTKHITADFLKKSVGDVFTDTTTSYYSGAGDGWTLVNSGTVWSTTVDGNAEGADYTNSSLQYNYAICDDYSTYRWYHGFYPINTAGITTDNTVTDAKMYLYVGNDLSQYNFEWSIVVTNQASTSQLVVSDHPLWTKTAISNAIATTSLTNTAMNYWTISDLTKVIRNGYTKFGIASGPAISGTAPGPKNSSKQCAFQSYGSEASGSNDPYLSVTYAPAATSVTVTPDALVATSVINDGTISTVRNISTLLSVQSLTSSQPAFTVALPQNITVITTVQSLTASQPTCTVYPLGESKLIIPLGDKIYYNLKPTDPNNKYFWVEL